MLLISTHLKATAQLFRLCMEELLARDRNIIDRAWTGILVLMIIVLFFFALTRFLSGRKGRV
jgi:ABC-type amino acid transport system permease subunit